MSDRVGVMYLGKLVEFGTNEQVDARPLHPYTQALFSNELSGRPDDVRDELLLKGEVPSAFNPPSGCRFHPRCPLAMPRCAEVEPRLEEEAPLAIAWPAISTSHEVSNRRSNDEKAD